MSCGQKPFLRCSSQYKIESSGLKLTAGENLRTKSILMMASSGDLGDGPASLEGSAQPNANKNQYLEGLNDTTKLQLPSMKSTKIQGNEKDSIPKQFQPIPRAKGIVAITSASSNNILKMKIEGDDANFAEDEESDVDRGYYK